MRRVFIVTFVVISLAVQALPARQTAPQARPVDPLAPRTSAEAAATGPLHTVTVCTSDLAGWLRLYRDGLGLQVRGPVAIDGERRHALNGLWGMAPAESWALYLLERPGIGEAVKIRLLVFDRPGSAIRRSADPREPAPFTLGFPTANLPPVDVKLRGMGFRSLAPMEQSQIPRPDGTKYGLQESVFTGPDLIHVVGVSRLDGMPQLGPVDPSNSLGGPAYSAQVVANSDAVIAFYRDVLGMELRSDREWKSGPTSAIGLPEGTGFRLALVYAQGASTGQLLFMDFRQAAAVPSGVAPRPPNRGLGVYSFPVKSLADTAKKLKAAGVTVIQEPVGLDSPDLGRVRVMSVLAPNGVVVELFERAAAGR